MDSNDNQATALITDGHDDTNEAPLHDADRTRSDIQTNPNSASTTGHNTSNEQRRLLEWDHAADLAYSPSKQLSFTNVDDLASGSECATNTRLHSEGGQQPNDDDTKPTKKTAASSDDRCESGGAFTERTSSGAGTATITELRHHSPTSSEKMTDLGDPTSKYNVAHRLYPSVVSANMRRRGSADIEDDQQNRRHQRDVRQSRSANSLLDLLISVDIDKRGVSPGDTIESNSTSRFAKSCSRPSESGTATERALASEFKTIQPPLPSTRRTELTLEPRKSFDESFIRSSGEITGSARGESDLPPMPASYLYADKHRSPLKHRPIYASSSIPEADDGAVDSKVTYGDYLARSGTGGKDRKSVTANRSQDELIERQHRPLSRCSSTDSLARRVEQLLAISAAKFSGPLHSRFSGDDRSLPLVTRHRTTLDSSTDFTLQSRDAAVTDSANTLLNASMGSSTICSVGGVATATGAGAKPLSVPDLASLVDANSYVTSNFSSHATRFLEDILTRREREKLATAPVPAKKASAVSVGTASESVTYKPVRSTSPKQTSVAVQKQSMKGATGKHGASGRHSPKDSAWNATTSNRQRQATSAAPACKHERGEESLKTIADDVVLLAGLLEKPIRDIVLKCLNEKSSTAPQRQNESHYTTGRPNNNKYDANEAPSDSDEPDTQAHVVPLSIDDDTTTNNNERNIADFSSSDDTTDVSDLSVGRPRSSRLDDIVRKLQEERSRLQHARLKANLRRERVVLLEKLLERESSAGEQTPTKRTVSRSRGQEEEESTPRRPMRASQRRILATDSVTSSVQVSEREHRVIRRAVSMATQASDDPNALGEDIYVTDAQGERHRLPSHRGLTHNEKQALYPRPVAFEIASPKRRAASGTTQAPPSLIPRSKHSPKPNRAAKLQLSPGREDNSPERTPRTHERGVDTCDNRVVVDRAVSIGVQTDTGRLQRARAEHDVAMQRSTIPRTTSPGRDDAGGPQRDVHSWFVPFKSRAPGSSRFDRAAAQRKPASPFHRNCSPQPPSKGRSSLSPAILRTPTRRYFDRILDAEDVAPVSPSKNLARLDGMSLQDALVTSRPDFMLRSAERLHRCQIRAAQRRAVIDEEDAMSRQMDAELRRRLADSSSNNSGGRRGAARRRQRDRPAVERAAAVMALHEHKSDNMASSGERTYKVSLRDDVDGPDMVQIREDTKKKKKKKVKGTKTDSKSKAKRRYSQLPEIRERRDQEVRERVYRDNRLRANLFKHRVLQQVLRRAQRSGSLFADATRV